MSHPTIFAMHKKYCPTSNSLRDYDRLNEVLYKALVECPEILDKVLNKLTSCTISEIIQILNFCVPDRKIKKQDIIKVYYSVRFFNGLTEENMQVLSYIMNTHL